jgi:hypothetical protein
MKKIYSKPLIEIEAYQLDASIAANCGTVVNQGPEAPGKETCSDFGDSFVVQSYRPGIGIQSVGGGTPFYNDGSANCDCYYQSGDSVFFTS